MEQDQGFSKLSRTVKNNKIMTGVLFATLSLSTLGYQYPNGIKITQRNDGSREVKIIKWSINDPFKLPIIETSRIVGNNLSEEKIRQDIIDREIKMKEESEKNQNNAGINQAGL